jgi:hypothetical protein
MPIVYIMKEKEITFGAFKNDYRAVKKDMTQRLVLRH